MIAPSLLDVGGTRPNDASPNIFVTAEKPERTVGTRFTVNNAEIIADAKLGVLAWTAVMVELPGPTMVTVLPSMVATAVFELVYVNAPSLLVVGATKLKAASPTVFTGTKKLASVDIPGTTVKVVVMVSVKKFMEVACTAVMVEVPIPTMVIMLPAIVATSVFELV